MDYGYIAIEGNIGSGKTTLSRMLANDFDAELVLEEFEDNEFLPKFYKDSNRYAFTLEMSFLADRYRQLSDLASTRNLFNTLRISDYLLSKSLIFASSNLKEDEMRLFRRVFDIMFATVPNPDLLIYLYSDTARLLENIRKRGRRYEQGIEQSYLNAVQTKYLEHLRQQKDRTRILVLDVTNVDFVENQAIYEQIKNLIHRPRNIGLTHEVL